MLTINRSLVILRPQQPFIDWVTSLLGSGPADVEALLRDATTVLIPEVDSEEEAWAYVERIASQLFELELEAWLIDPEGWPKRRGPATFRRWFAIELHSTILDPGADELVREPY